MGPHTHSLSEAAAHQKMFISELDLQADPPAVQCITMRDVMNPRSRLNSTYVSIDGKDPISTLL
jgi:hypothetical protein